MKDSNERNILASRALILSYAVQVYYKIALGTIIAPEYCKFHILLFYILAYQTLFNIRKYLNIIMFIKDWFRLPQSIVRVHITSILN